MDNKHFAELVKGIKQMKRHLAGKHVPGIRVTRVDVVDSPAPAVRPRSRRKESNR